ncbi:MAG: hypothetical protein SCK28_01340 [Bacillota bacterium]|nr:hypothetical protein [Bacillota bacterium]
MSYCPICQGKAVGKVGTNQFYCWDCFVEFTTNSHGVQVYEVDEEGNLLNYSPEAEMEMTVE